MLEVVEVRPPGRGDDDVGCPFRDRAEGETSSGIENRPGPPVASGSMGPRANSREGRMNPSVCLGPM
jgi:hypothetical protein